MRRFINSPEGRRVTAFALVATLLFSLVLPVVAGATTYRVTCSSNVSSRYVGQTFKITGKATPSRAGQYVTVEFRKSTSPVWYKSSRKVSSYHTYSYKFYPRSAGTYYVRARFKGTVSSKLKLTVKPRTKVILASTTSTQDSGLFDVMVPAFERAYPKYDLQVVAVGTGAALEMGRRDDADVLLVHSPDQERTFVAQGYGHNRRAVMHNDFLLVGPSSDPGAIKAAGGIGACFKKIYTNGSTFVSRSDGSGTYTKEKSLWVLAGYSGYPTGQPWYIGANAGMGDTLRLAAEKQGYTLVDRATWVTNRPAGMTSVQEGDFQYLGNPYSVIEVIGAKQPTGAAVFSNWVVSDSAQNLIWNFGYAKYRQHLFWPDAN